MKRFLQRHRPALALGLLLLVGVVLAQIAAARNADQQGGPALSSLDATPGGSLALARWLESQGFRVDRLEGSGSSPDDTVRYLFVLRPSVRFDQADARSIIEWVRRGGTLIYIPGLILEPSAGTPELGDGLDRELNLSPRIGPASQVPLAISPGPPFFTAPPASQFHSTTPFELYPTDPSWIPLIDEVENSTDRRVLVARRRYGAGQAVAIASDDFVSNGHIADGDNLALLLNVLARGAPDKVAAFDEYHHGVAAAPDLILVARSQPWGWVLAYLAVLSFIFAIWSGRRFGPPIVLEKLPGRSTGDYVTAFAGLLQRNVAKGGASAWAQAQYSRLVRRGLGRTQGIRADLPAQDLARILAERRPIDAAALSEQLAKLGGPPLTNRALLDTVRSLEPILRTLEPPDAEAGGRKRPTT